MKLKNPLVVVIILIGVTVLGSSCSLPIESEHQKLLNDIVSLEDASDCEKAINIIESQKGVKDSSFGEDFSDLSIRYDINENEKSYVRCYSTVAIDMPPSFCEERGRKLRAVLRDQIPELRNRPL